RTLHPGAKEPFNKGMMWSRCGNVVLCGHPRQCQRAERQDAQDGKLGQVMVRCRTWRKTAAFLYRRRMAVHVRPLFPSAVTKRRAGGRTITDWALPFAP